MGLVKDVSSIVDGQKKILILKVTKMVSVIRSVNFYIIAVLLVVMLNGADARSIRQNLDVFSEDVDEMRDFAIPMRYGERTPMKRIKTSDIILSKATYHHLLSQYRHSGDKMRNRRRRHSGRQRALSPLSRLSRYR